MPHRPTSRKPRRTCDDAPVQEPGHPEPERERLSAAEHDAAAAAQRGGDTILARLGRIDPFWGAQLLILGAILLDLTLSERITLGPFWLLPALEFVALAGLTGSTTAPVRGPNGHRALRLHPLRRRLSLGIIALVSAANIASLVLLCQLLIDGGKASGRALIGSGMVLWVTNVLLFAVWFWQLDRGGPLARKRGEADQPDFLFVQMANPDVAPRGWEPSLIDYLYTSFTNATAFSPTDTMPLTPTAKLLMTAQSATALVTVGLVVARAVNILS
jgi:hypothetical protein